MLELFLVLVIDSVNLFISLILFAMLIRAVMSIFMFGEDSKFGMFIYWITEPLIMPIRALFARLGWFQGTPLDASFFFTCVLLGMLRTVLASIPISF